MPKKPKSSLPPKRRGRPTKVKRGRRAYSDSGSEDDTSPAPTAGNTRTQSVTVSEGGPDSPDDGDKQYIEDASFINQACHSYVESMKTTERLQRDADNNTFYVGRTNAQKDNLRTSIETLHTSEVNAFFDALV